MNPDMPDDHKTIFQSALQHCSNCENNVEKWLRHKDKRPDPARFNAVFSKEVDKLSEILEDIKQNVGN
jgi:hypothetical protein